MTKPALTPKQEQFCREYLIDLNATQAAIRAGYSAKTARAIGAENLTKPDIAARIESLMAGRLKRTDLSGGWVVDRLKEAAEKNLGAEASQAAGIKALDLLGRHFGIFGEDNKQKAAVSTEDIIRALDERDERKRQELREQNGAGVTDIRKVG